MLGKTGKICMDCIKLHDFRKSYIPRTLQKYDAKQVLSMLKNKEIMEKKITRKRKDVSTWQKVEDLN